MKITSKSAFTLLEMLVVIGIIGVLMGVIVSQFGGATESAKAAKCETNMRSLVTAAHTCATDGDGHFPPASSFSYMVANEKTGGIEYHNYRVGWISGSETRPAVSQQPISFQIIPFNADEDLKGRNGVHYALTNGYRGAMWRAMGASRTAYQCPVHAEAVRKQIGHMPGWSYVMNVDFGHDTGKHKWMAKNKGDMSNASRLLMFAELQGADIDERGYDKIDARKYLRANGEQADAVLDYTKENIGFNHKTSKRGVSGHVAFADGHVERLFYPRSGAGISLQKLTEALCKGHEISYDGKNGYTDLQQNQ